MTLTLASAPLTLKQVFVAEKKTKQRQAESALVFLVEFEVRDVFGHFE